MRSGSRYTPEQALQYAAGICARSEQCEYDIRRKLTIHGVTGCEADRIIDYLTDHDFVNEERYARAYCRDKARFSRWGRIKIRAGLFARRVSRDAVSEGLASIDEDSYREGLQRLARQLVGEENLRDRDVKMRLMRRLASRGFEPNLISEALCVEIGRSEADEGMQE